ncbi:MAG: hypothetical protein HRT67_06100 [Flavobacteriaceae bacterium]|nr:hypothetical protein [Flavobacteriaceae bacterium]
MTVDKLIDLVNDLPEKEVVFLGLENLSHAIFGWNIEVDTIEEYLEEVKLFLSIEELNSLILNKALRKKSINDFIDEINSISELIVFLDKNNGNVPFWL